MDFRLTLRKDSELQLFRGEAYKPLDSHCPPTGKISNHCISRAEAVWMAGKIHCMAWINQNDTV